MKLEVIYQIKSSENESWIDVPKNLYNSIGNKFKAKRKLYTRDDISGLHQEAIANYYNTDRKEYHQGKVDVLEELLNSKP